MLAALGVSLAAVLSGGCGTSEDRPNLLLITVDSLRRDTLEDYGARVKIPVEVMPNTDRLMDRSTVLLDCYTVSPRTTQSLASLMTGTYPTDNGCFGLFHTLPDNARTLAEVLRDEGYRTYAVTTSYFLQRGRGFEQGFETYDDELFHRTADYAEFVADRTELLTNEGLEEPFFLWVHFTDPAWPYDPPRELVRAFHAEYAEEFTLFEDIEAGKVSRGKVIFENDLSREDRRHLQRRYLGEVSYVDQHLGRIFGIMESLGLLENTLTAFCGTQGESMGENDYYFAHGEALYQSTVAVPAFFHFPGRLERRLVEGQTSTVDLAPTMLDLLGVDPAALGDPSGLSITGSFRGEEHRRGAAFMESAYQLIHAENPRFDHLSPLGKWRGLVAGDYKLIKVPTEDGAEWELYDLAADPGETKNLVDEQPALAERLRLILADWDQLVDEQAGRVASVHEETSRDLRGRGYKN